jgi:hypothetical protein
MPRASHQNDSEAPSAVAIRLGIPRVERSNPRRTYLLTDIVADLDITLNGMVAFSESAFPVVELAAAIGIWLRSPERQGWSFEFESVEAEESPLFEFREADMGWAFSSPWQKNGQDVRVPREIVVAALQDFVERTQVAVREIGFDVSDLIDKAAKRWHVTSEEWWVD